MTTIQEVEFAVSRLSEKELELFRLWYEEFDAKLWDEQFEKDAYSGKLDNYAKMALNEIIS